MDTELTNNPVDPTAPVASEQCGCTPVPETPEPPKDNTNFWLIVAGTAFILFLMFG